MQSQFVFKAVLCCITVVALPLTHAVYSNYSSRCSSGLAAGLPCPRLIDLAPGILYGAAFVVARYLFSWISVPIGNHLIQHRKPRGNSLSSQKAHDAKVARFSHHLFRFVYFISVTVCAYQMLQAEPFFPAEFGGTVVAQPGAHNEQKSIYETSFSQSQALNPTTVRFIRTYFCMTLGFQLASAYFLCERQLSDLWESIVQLLLGMQLVVFGYLANHLAVGACLLFMHDACDVLTSACKALVDSRYKTTTFVSAVVLMTAWAYVRLFCLAKLLLIPLMYTIEVTQPYRNGDYETILFAGLLLCLFFMNIYWFALMAKSCFIFVVSGRVTDTHSPQLHLDTQSAVSTTRPASTGSQLRRRPHRD